MWNKYFDGHNMPSQVDNEFIRSLSYRPRKIILTESHDEESELVFIKLNKGWGNLRIDNLHAEILKWCGYNIMQRLTGRLEISNEEYSTKLVKCFTGSVSRGKEWQRLL